MSFAWKGFHSWGPGFSPAFGPSITSGVSADFTVASPSLPVWLSLARADATPLATYRNSSGYVTTVASAGDARFDHDYAGTPLGLLLEPARTNTQLNSSTAASWTATRSTLTANNLLGPDNTTSMSKVVSDATASNTHPISRIASIASGSRYAFSAYFRASGPTAFANITPSSTPFGSGQAVFYGLTAGGVVTQVGAGAPAAGIERAANSTYRAWMSPLSASSTTSTYATVVALSQDGTSTTFNGDSATALGVWGVQVEAGEYPTSLIVTGASAVTRAADVLTMTGYASNVIIAEQQSLATGVTSFVTYAGSAAFNAAMNGPGIRLRKVWILA